MTTKSLSSVTNELIVSYGNTARNMINAYRVGNERAVSFMDQRWASAVEKARISDEVRGNALAAQQKFSGLYAKGIALTSDSADSVVGKAMGLAEKGVEQVATGVERFEKATGMTTLNTLAVAAVPAAEAVTKVAARLEAQSGEWVNRIAGSQAHVRVAKVKRTVARKASRARKAAAV